MTARSCLAAALRGDFLTEEDADMALRRLMMAIRRRLTEGEDVRLPGVGVISPGRPHRRGGRTIIEVRLDRSIGSVVGRL